MRKKTRATGIDIFFNGRYIEHHDSFMSASRKYFPNNSNTYLCTTLFANNKRGITEYTDARGYTFVKTNNGKMSCQKAFKIFDKAENKSFMVDTMTKLLEKTKINQRRLYRQIEIYGNYDDSRYTIWRAEAE